MYRKHCVLHERLYTPLHHNKCLTVNSIFSVVFRRHIFNLISGTYEILLLLFGAVVPLPQLAVLLSLLTQTTTKRAATDHVLTSSNHHYFVVGVFS